MKVNAYAPTSVLLTTLARSYWGVLDGEENRGMRIVLTSIQQAANTKFKHRFNSAGEVYVTAWQLARISGYSERWTRFCLQRLEELGIISWVRGMIVAGKPTVSILRISKKAICELIAWARPVKDEEEAKRREEFQMRVKATARYKRVPSKATGSAHTNRLHARFTSSHHAEVNASPPLLKKENNPRPDRARAVEPKISEDIKRFVMDLGAASRGGAINGKESDMRLPPRPAFDPALLPAICEHDRYTRPSVCLRCREAATDKRELEAWNREVLRLQGVKPKPLVQDEIIDEQITEAALEIAKSRGLKMAALAKALPRIKEELKEQMKLQQGALL